MINTTKKSRSDKQRNNGIQVKQHQRDTTKKTVSDRRILKASQRFKRNPEPLKRLTRNLRTRTSLEACYLSAQQLLQHEPKSRTALISLLFYYSVKRDVEALQQTLTSAKQNAGQDTAKLAQLVKKASENLTKREKKILKEQASPDHKKAEENQLKKQIKEAKLNYKRDPDQLICLTKKLRQKDTRKACKLSAKQLLKKDQCSIEAYISLYYYCATSPEYSREIRDVLDFALLNLQKAANPGSTTILNSNDRKVNKAIKNIKAKVINIIGEEEEEKFARHLSDHHKESEKISNHRKICEQATKRLNQRMVVKENTCDVICIASNEGPYIAEFIHHYLYLGFSNIFIGLNNDSSGETGPIIQSIAEKFPNIHLINTDQAHQNGKQRGSNCQLYSEAARVSTSSHCMVVDVDEYWVTTPFSNKISDFLKEFPDANVISSNWFHCHGGDLFGNPLDLSKTQLRLTSQVKSLFRYGLEVTSLGAHVPWVKATQSCKHVNSNNQFIKTKPFNGIRRLQKNAPIARIGEKHSSWVIHRHTRSEIEYACKLLYPRPNEKEIPFKTNRIGFIMPKEKANSRQLAINLFGKSNQPPQEYYNSLKGFIEKCGIHHAINEARSKISDPEIKTKINNIPKSVIAKHKAIWRKTFRKTRYLKLLEERIK